MQDYKDKASTVGRSATWLMRGASVAALSFATVAGAVAQDAGAGDDEEARQDTIVVTGIRGSLQRAMDIKRNSSGVVDAISAEDMGKFPDTNLAESLQRITGVSIDRVNGEGSQVTVRGFGPGFNQVTLNGRVMPTADLGLVGGDQGAGGSTDGADRAFDFSNIASEGVSGLEVYKTGKANVASGGLGASINIKTVRPLDNPGLQGTIGGKIIHDTSVENGDDYTPEVSGLFSWTDESDSFGVSLFGSYQKRDNAAPSASSASWNVQDYASFPGLDGSTQITNAPSDPTFLTSVPRDSRLHFSEFSRERLNGQLVLQFQPSENLRLTGDITYAETEAEEKIADQSVWFNRPFSEVVFDQNQPVATAVFLREVISGAKDLAFQQELRSTKDTLESFGFNAEWDVSEALKVSLDAHSSKAEASPNGPNGVARIRVGVAAPVMTAHSVDYSGDIPQQAYVIDDSIRGNGNGVVDAGDIGTQVGRTTALSQENTLDQVQLDATYEFNDSSSLTVGLDWVSAENRQLYSTTQQTLGDWGISNPGDVEQVVPGGLTEFCIACQFNDFDPGAGAFGSTGFIGDAATLYAGLSSHYAGLGNAVGVTSNTDDTVKEETLSLYAQMDTHTQVFDRPADFVFGLRYESTDVTSTSLISVPSAIIWAADNDFSQVIGSQVQPVTVEASYDLFLPNVDFSVDVTDDVVARASYSKTVGRTAYNNLFASATAGSATGNPPGPTGLSNVPTGTSGNPGLLPLESDNFDVSLEWYYGEANFVSIGAFEKRVKNFVGTGQTTRTLFDLRDPSSTQPGTRSGDALALLQSIGAGVNDVNLFTMTALIDDNPATAEAVFLANSTGGVLDQAFVDSTLAAFDITANADDPFYQFQVTQPINNREAKINGIEIAGQHFFADTGFGLAGSYTLVDADVGIDVAGDPTVDQFALVGLSDTANITAIYEKHGLSARLAYNWRDEFLASTNRGGGFRNPEFREAFGQFDFSVNYDLNDAIVLSLEGINVLGEDYRSYGRTSSNLWFAQENEPRFMIGARYKY